MCTTCVLASTCVLLSSYSSPCLLPSLFSILFCFFSSALWFYFLFPFAFFLDSLTAAWVPSLLYPMWSPTAFPIPGNGEFAEAKPPLCLLQALRVVFCVWG